MNDETEKLNTEGTDFAKAVEPAAERLLDLGITVLCLGVIFFCASHSVSECLWGNLMNGLDFINAGGVIRQDKYSFMSDVPWIDHEWLFETILAWTYKLAGSVGMNGFKLCVDLCFAALMIRHLRLSKLPAFYAAALPVWATAFMSGWILAPRPQIIDVLFFGIVACALAQLRNGRRFLFYTLPVLFALWANLHASFVAGLGIVYVWCFMDLFQQFSERKTFDPALKKDLLSYSSICAASGLAILITPYGIQLPLFLLSALSMPHSEFPNWHPISFGSLLGKFYVITILCVITVLFNSKKKKSWAAIASFILICLQPLSAYRHTVFVFISALAFFADDLANWLSAAGQNDPFAKFNARSKKIMGSLAIIASLALVSAGLSKLSKLPIPQDWPVDAVAVIKASGLSGNLVTNFDWSDYCLWHLKPAIKISVDSRRETAFSARAIALNLAFTLGAADWDDILKKYPVNLVLTSKNQPEFPLMMLKPGWQLCYQDNVAAIFAPTDSEEARRIRMVKIPPISQREFP